MKRCLALISLCATALAGCDKPAELVFVSSQEFQGLKPNIQAAVAQALTENCATPSHPKMLWQPNFDQKQLELGFRVYQKRCTQCHGSSGDGNGPVASSLYPRPRDYRKGVFKFGSTPFGLKPTREDLILTVTRGVTGTSMPAFHLLPKKEIEAVIDYVLALTHRGELEGLLVPQLEDTDEMPPEVVQETIDLIKDRWLTAPQDVYLPMSPQPTFTSDHVEAGRKAFLTKGCAQCHGEDGRGQTPENLNGTRKDEWGHLTRAADLTSGMLHGGSRPLDIYRRIYGGINGTPMPAFNNTFKEEPETIWNLVAYVLHVSGRRRAGDIPPSGSIAPYSPPSSGTSQ